MVTKQWWYIRIHDLLKDEIKQNAPWCKQQETDNSFAVEMPFNVLMLANVQC